ncbi:MAG TPA: ComEC/Rec2 family competence protein [Candidatus Saccharimonadales bacterium]|nr:ComEC/Rec2 family competence protein [Candidatus Saccharimonadales bacterium]
MARWYRRTVHSSWLIAWAAGGVVAGVALAGWAGEPLLLFAAMPWLLAAAILLTIAGAKRTAAAVPLVVGAGLLLGLWRGAGEQQARIITYTPWFGHTVTLTGTVSEDATRGAGGDVRLTLTHVTANKRDWPGTIWASTLSTVSVRRGDSITLRGSLDHGFGSFAASLPYAGVEHITHPLPGDLGVRLRDWFSGGVRRAIPEPQASLGAGYLLGQNSALPQPLEDALKTVGLTHAVVASGYNLTILVAFARRRFLNISKYIATLAAAALAGSFILIAGFSPSMVRAGLVTGLSLAAWYYGRTVHPLVLLPLAAAITVLIDPAYAWGDLGWALSFAAFAGVIVLAPLVQRTVWGRRPVGMMRDIVISTLAAQAATLPIMLSAFGQYSPYALLANVLVLPLIPFTMVLIFAGGVAGITLPAAAAHWVGWPALVLLHYMTSVVGFIAGLPGAAAAISFPTGAVIIAYTILLVLLYVLWRKTHYNFRDEQPAE